MLAVAGGAAQAYSPELDAETTLSPTFVWKDGPQFASYTFRLFRADTGTSVSLTIPANGQICPNNTECRLAPGAPGYPALETRDYSWAVLGFNPATGLTQFWDPDNFSPFHPLPDEVSSLDAEWIGNSVDLGWPAAKGASSYHASFMNWATVTSSEVFSCTTPSCSGTGEVSQIPYGTVQVRLRACGLSGRCTAGVTAEARKTCPAPLPTPALATPTQGEMVKGTTVLRWAEPTNAERYRIQLERNTSVSPPVVEIYDSPWRSEVACKPAGGGLLCERAYAIPPGDYSGSLAASCGGEWSPEAPVAFTVMPDPPLALVTPKILSPKEDATTSIYPAILWAKLPDNSSYELIVTAMPPGSAVPRSHAVTCDTPICVYDFAKENDFAIGAFTVAVRIAAEGMPFSVVRNFTGSFAYRPPAVEQSMPVDLQPIADDTPLAVQFNADVQAPFSVLTVTGPNGFTTAERIERASPPCQFVLTGGGSGLAGAGVVSSCLYSFKPFPPLGLYTSTVAAASPSNAAGTSTAMTPGRNVRFVRVGAQGRDIYTVFAQNAQFLPESGPFGHGGGASSAWNMSDRTRAAKLQDYLHRKEFDVVALTEVFVSEAQEELKKLLSPTYSYYAAKIDTAGFASADEMFAEQDSGLAIFSKFKPEAVTPGSESNYQCTTDVFNEIDESNDELASFDLNDHLWYKQFCKTEGDDRLAAKGVAGINLANPHTGSPLLIAWAHTQAATDDETDSYEARDSNIGDDAGPAVRSMLDSMPSAYDALILGDWNLNQPRSVGQVPKFFGNNTQQNFGAALGDLYPQASVESPDTSPDASNPKLSDLVPKAPEPDEGPTPTLYQQYWTFFDPRNTARTFSDFYDLWLENPAGDPGLTFDVSGRRTGIGCTEFERETCGNRYAPPDPKASFDSGSRYDTVLARFHTSNIRNAPGIGQPYPAPSPAWLERRSCVQHVSLARDFAYSDHFGTIIEVGPEAPFCNPMEAKADPHLWREPNTAPFLDPKKPGYDRKAGVHNGWFRHRGANEWFFVSEPGAFDLIIEGKDASMDGIIVEAFLPSDISTPIPVADSIAEACGKPETRVTFRSPGQLYFRITPARYVDKVNKPGVARRCTSCTGRYYVRFRERTCRKPVEAIAVSSGFSGLGLNSTEQGWFGVGQKSCWFQLEMQKPSSATDFQTLSIANVGSLDNEACTIAAASGGNCSRNYEVDMFTDKVTADAIGPTLWRFSQRAAPVGGGRTDTASVDARWSLVPEADTGRKAYYVRTSRDDTSRPHPAYLNWDTNLKSVVFQSISTTNIEDDYLFTIWNPFGDDIQVSDPLNNTDELRIRQFSNGGQLNYVDYDLNVDNAGNDTYRFPDMWPDFPMTGIDGKPRVYGGRFPTDNNRGTWINYTSSARVEATERDDFTAFDWVVADHLTCGVSGTAPPGGWQTKWFLDTWAWLPGQPLRSATKVWTFDDICGGDSGKPTWRYEFKAGVDRTQ
jgi:hypothetical protein